MDAIEAVYEGQIRIRSEACQTAASVQSWGLRRDGDAARSSLVFYRTASGDQEMYTCRQGDDIAFRILLEPDDIAIIMRGGSHVTLLPADSVVSLGYLGFILPTSVSKLVFRAVTDSRQIEDVCNGLEGCSSGYIDRASGSRDTLAVTDYGRSFLMTIANRPQSRWKLEGLSGKFPEKINFWAYDYDGSVLAEANWILKEWKEIPRLKLHRDQFIKADASEIIMKDGTGLGGKYDPGRKDTWKLYNDQLAMHSGFEEPARPPYAAIGLGILAACLIAVGTWIRLSAKRR